MSAIYVGLSNEAILKNSITIQDSGTIPTTTETDLVSYTVPASKTFTVIGGSGSGLTDGTFKLYVNGTLKETLRNSWTNRDIKFKTQAVATTGQIVKITVEHNNSDSIDFDGSIVGVLL